MNIHTLKNLGRFKDILSVFIQYGFADIIRILEIPGSNLVERIVTADPDKSPSERFRLALDELGPTFVKFGQILSMRAEMLPEPLIQELKKLQDDASPVDAGAIRNLIEQNYERSLGEVFLSFDSDPIAAASLSQVHRAVLRDSVAQVVVKVQRPGIESTVMRDLDIMASIAERIHERMDDMRIYDLPGLVNVARESMLRELDFSREGRYLQIARTHMADVEGLYVPEAYMALTTPQILVMEYIDGERLGALDLASLEDPEAMARNGLRATVKQLFEVGFFHADPHPGNTLIVDKRTICLLDWGMVGRLTPEDRHEVTDLLTAIVNKDSRGLVEAIMTVTHRSVDVDRRALERDLLDIIDSHMVASVSELRLGRLMMEATQTIKKHRLQIPPDMFLMIKALVSAEGLVQMIYPKMDLVEELRPHLKRIIGKRFTPESIVNSIQRSFFRIINTPNRLPKRIGYIIEKMERDRLGIRFEHRGLESLQQTFEKIFSRLTMGIILAAMVIGSSLIITTGVPPIVWGYPLLGLAGYLISALLGLWVVFDILRSR